MHPPALPAAPLWFLTSDTPFKSGNKGRVEAGAGVATLERKDLFLLVGL